MERRPAALMERTSSGDEAGSDQSPADADENPSIRDMNAKRTV